MLITLIACVARNMAIGRAGRLIYRIPADMRRFKETTLGHTVIMGRRTWESLPLQPLPDRRNIVLTHRGTMTGADCRDSLYAALDTCIRRREEEAFIIGGESVFALAIGMADRLLLTEVDDSPTNADAFFPHVNEDRWEPVSMERHKGEYAYDFTFTEFTRT